RRVIRIPEKGNAREAGNKLFEEFYPFGTNVWTEDRVASDIPTRTSQAHNEPGSNGIADRNHNNRNCLRCSPGREARGRPVGPDDVSPMANELCGSVGEPFRFPIAISIVKGNVLPFDVAKIAQRVSESVPLR